MWRKLRAQSGCRALRRPPHCSHRVQKSKMWILSCAVHLSWNFFSAELLLSITYYLVEMSSHWMLLSTCLVRVWHREFTYVYTDSGGHWEGMRSLSISIIQIFLYSILMKNYLLNGSGSIKQLMPLRCWFILKVTQTQLLSHNRTSKSSSHLSFSMIQSLTFISSEYWCTSARV